MNEKEFDQWLQEQDFSRSMTGEYDVVLPKQTITTNSNCQKSETLILPLSLENNATTTGTAAIIEEFGKEFGVPCQHAKEYCTCLSIIMEKHLILSPPVNTIDLSRLYKHTSHQ